MTKVYKSPYKYQGLLIHESEEGAMMAMTILPSIFNERTSYFKSNIRGSFNIAEVFKKTFGNEIFISNGDDLLFLIEKIDTTSHEIWHVIAGERTGWVVIPDWLKMEIVE